MGSIDWIDESEQGIEFFRLQVEKPRGEAVDLLEEEVEPLDAIKHRRLFGGISKPLDGSRQEFQSRVQLSPLSLAEDTTKQHPHIPLGTEVLAAVAGTVDLADDSPVQEFT